MRMLIILLMLVIPVNAEPIEKKVLRLKKTAIKPPRRDRRLCMQKNLIVDIIEKRYRERILFQGVGRNNKYATRLYLNRQTGTWSFVLFYPTGITCIDNTGMFGETTWDSRPLGRS